MVHPGKKIRFFPKNKSSSYRYLREGIWQIDGGCEGEKPFKERLFLPRAPSFPNLFARIALFQSNAQQSVFCRKRPSPGSYKTVLLYWGMKSKIKLELLFQN